MVTTVVFFSLLLLVLHGKRNALWLIHLIDMSAIFMVNHASSSRRQLIHRGLLDCIEGCHVADHCIYSLYQPGYRRCQVQTRGHIRKFNIDINPEKIVWGVQIKKDTERKTETKFICKPSFLDRHHIRYTSCTVRVPRSCTGTRPYVTHGIRISANATHLVYKCKRRYNEIGPIFSVCDDGTWTRPKEKCKGDIVRCSDPAPDVANAHKTRVLSTRQLYECDRGYAQTGSIFAMCVGTKWRISEQVCARFRKPKSVGRVTDQVRESSGLAASRRHHGYLYTHNDYHMGHEVFVLDAHNGEHVATLTIQGAVNNDWEDIAVGTCGNETCMYIGDFGGHESSTSRYVIPANVIYRVREPEFLTDQTLPVDSRLKFRWDFMDANTLLVDTDGTLYAISHEDDAPSYLHKLPDTWGSLRRTKARRYHEIGECSCEYRIWGGDISPDGKTLVLAVSDGILYWDLRNGGILEATRTTPEPVPSNLESAQGAGFRYDSTGFYALEEKSGHELYYFPPA